MHTIKKHLQYNAWANGKIAEILLKLDDQVLDHDIKSSFPSLRKTVFHIWDAQQIWLWRLRGVSATTWPSIEFNGTNEELFAEFLKNSNDFTDFIVSKGDSYLVAIVDYKNMKGDSFSSGVDDIVFHVVNHGTFHRGQIITMLRELGFTSFDSQDLITYLRM